VKKGPFSPQEVGLLLNAVCQYAKDLGLDEEGLAKLCKCSKSEMDKEMKGAWCKIAECLPMRSVQACHNFCKRKFNEDNYNGKWSFEEEKRLVELIEQEGQKWLEISRILNLENETKRTAANVKDKWKQLGGDNWQLRNKGPWTLEEGLELVNFVCAATDCNLVAKNKPVKIKYGKKEGIKRGYEADSTSIKVYSESVGIEDILPLIMKPKRSQKRAASLEISWTALAAQMKYRSYDDIRNYWTSKVLPILLQSYSEWSHGDDRELVK